MGDLRAGFGRSDITPHLGCQLVGYGTRASGAQGVHDPLLARTLVLEEGGERWAIIACDLCFVAMPVVKAIRGAVAAQSGIEPSHIFVASTHTHSGPDDQDASSWPAPLADLVAASVAQACEALQPARIGGGFGMLHGYSINRRWIDRPIDPGVGVVRIDDLAGKPLGLLTNFGCHAVVMGPDNLLISADWPGHACQNVENTLGLASTCLFLPGGCGEINPLVAGVREQLQSGRTIVSIGNISAYYGEANDPQRWNVGSRTGGTFAEVAELGDAFSAEVLRVAGRIATQTESKVWSRQLFVDAARAAGEPVREVPAPFDAIDPAIYIDNEGRIPAEVMLLAINGILLIGEPGEVFAETAVRFRTHLRLLGYSTPLLVGYANGRLDYLPEPEAFDEGGYEPSYPSYMGISRYFQQRVWDAVESALRANDPTS